MQTLITPILIITIGVGWLLSTMGVMPAVSWVWTLGLAVAGILSFVTAGWNKLTVVVGPLLLAASLFSLLRQTGRLMFAQEIPILTILLGVLLLVARSKKIPMPAWIDGAAYRKP
jgi:hypothetical protein